MAAVVPTEHPDATAFAARFLAQPEDRLGRLVFADWLDEQGGESNTAWAQYLRSMASGEADPDSFDARVADFLGQRVRARLTLGSVPSKRVLSRLRAFLPDHRIWIRIGKTRFSRAIQEQCPEYVARRCSSILVEADASRVYVVCGLPVAEQYEPRQMLEFVLGREVVAFRGFPEDVVCALNNHYGWPEVQFIDGMLQSPETEIA